MGFCPSKGLFVTRCVHFIGFRGPEYHLAARAFGPPHFIHLRAFREIDWDHDLIVFANKEREGVVHKFNAPDVTGPGYEELG